MTTIVPNTNKIPEVSGLIKKIDYDNKISDADGKYFTTSNYENITKETTKETTKLQKILGAKMQERSYLIFLIS